MVALVGYDVVTMLLALKQFNNVDIGYIVFISSKR